MKAAAVIIAILAGCATNQVDLGPRDLRDIMSRDELAAHSFTTAYEAIASLRNWWLPERRATLGQAVYRDSARIAGSYFVLREIAIDTVRELRFLDRAQAVTLWGPTLEDRPGVIQIISR